MKVKVKVCGITNINDAIGSIENGADALGFIFAKSPRRISITAAARICLKLPPFVTRVGVFVDAPKKEVMHAVRSCHLDALQFHGAEDDKYCEFFKKYCKIIKAFRVKDKTSIDLVQNYKSPDAFLFDSYVKGLAGGTGKTVALQLLKNKKFKKPIIIAGGVTSSNVKKIIKFLKPYAVDVTSGVERNPGKKNIAQVRNLIKNANAVNL